MTAKKDKAEIVFSTVHRAKGMEYDTVQLVNDFITREKIEKLRKEELAKSKLNEEINLLYVAITRTKNTIYIPEALLPENFPPHPQIIVLKPPVAEDAQDEHEPPPYYQPYRGGKVITVDFKKNLSSENFKKIDKEPYKPWPPGDDMELVSKYKEGISINELAQHFGRTNGAIKSRLKRLQLK